jgi:hypothetical protein
MPWLRTADQVDRGMSGHFDRFDMKPPHEFRGGSTFDFCAPRGFLVEVFHQPWAEHRGGGEPSVPSAGAEQDLVGRKPGPLSSFP